MPRLTDRSLDFSLTPGESLPYERRSGPLADAISSADPPDEPVGPVSLPSYEPPWTPEWARGVMFAAVSTTVASRRLDERTLGRKMSRQEGLRAVPWQRRLSTRRGVQLLLDHGAGMVPFQDDRRWLRELAGSIAGRDRVETLRFAGSPLRGVVRNDPADPQPYRPPAPGTPVVFVSDLGRVQPPFAGDPGVPAHDWQDFVYQLLRSGCPAVCLTPYSSAEYSQALRDKIALIPFDRRISLRHAQEALRRIRQATEARA